MRAAGAWLLVCLLCWSQRGHAQDRAHEAGREPSWSLASSSVFDAVPRYALGLQLRGGGATTPFFTQAFPIVRGHGLVLQLAGAYRLSRSWLLEAQMPLVLVSLAQPAGSYLDVFSWGNANLSAQRRGTLWRGERSVLYGVAGAALALPIAQRGPSESQFGLRALQVASAMDGLRDQELYTSGVLPIAGSGALFFERATLGLELGLRLPIFVRFSRAALSSEASPRWLATTPVLHLAARYTLTRWLAPSLAADTVFNGRGPVRAARRAASTQFTLLPALTFRMRERWLLRSEFVLPIAGPLGGHAYAGGLLLGFEQ